MRSSVNDKSVQAYSSVSLCTPRGARHGTASSRDLLAGPHIVYDDTARGLSRGKKIVKGNVDSDRQSLRGFLRLVETEYPDELLRVREPIDLRFDATALVFELDHAGKSPVVVFENVRGSGMQLVTNVAGNRKLLAACLGVEPGNLPTAFRERCQKYIPCEMVDRRRMGRRGARRRRGRPDANCRSRCNSRSMRRLTSPLARSWRAIP